MEKQSAVSYNYPNGYAIIYRNFGPAELALSQFLLEKLWTAVSAEALVFPYSAFSDLLQEAVPPIGALEPVLEKITELRGYKITEKGLSPNDMSLPFVGFYIDPGAKMIFIQGNPKWMRKCMQNA